MAEIAPFRGLRYNPEKIDDLSKVMAPPYDVISPDMQEELYLRHPYNIVRLILGHTYEDDAPGNDRYSRAASFLKRWQKEGALVRDERPSIYYYTQRYASEDGAVKTRKGFMALLKLEELGHGIHPHEKTLAKPKVDRLNLMKATNANLCPVFSLYPEPADVLSVTDMLEAAIFGEPALDVAGDDGAGNRLWTIDDESVIRKVTLAMRRSNLFIADGHHRYETALNYRDFMLKTIKNPTGDEPFNYIMMYFASMEDKGLDIFPTHRVIHGLKGFRGEEILKTLKGYFDILEFPFTRFNEASVRKEFLKNMPCERLSRFGFYIRGRDIFYLATLKSGKIMDEVFGETLPSVYKTLDVSILHALILNRLIGLTDEAQDRQENIIYIKDVNRALDEGKKPANQIVFLMNPTHVEDIRRVSEAGLLMPQKSTYFHPKLLSGLVMNPLWD